MKIIFMGTPEFSVPALIDIIKTKHEVVGAYSQPPRPKGRGQSVRNSPVHEAALEYNIPVFTPKSLKSVEAQEEFASLSADLAVVVAYGLLLPAPILDACKCINIHASLLPRWRGAAPLQRAIEAGDTKTGITIMQMDEGLDTGDILLKSEVNITPKMNSSHLHDELSVMGAKLIVQALEQLEAGELSPIKQLGEATYAAKLKKEEARIDWSLPGEQLIRNVRAFNPYPGAYFEYKGEKIKLLEADFSRGLFDEDCNKSPGTVLNSEFAISCSDGKILPQLVQRQGKKKMPIGEFLKGFQAESGVVV